MLTKSFLLKIFLGCLLISLPILITTHGHHHHHGHDHDHHDHHGHDHHGHDHHHHHGHSHDYGQGHNHGQNETIEYLSHLLSNKLRVFLQGYKNVEQAYIGAALISSSSIPIFILLAILRIHMLKIVLNIFTAFSAGALLGEVFVHSIPEMYAEENKRNVPRELIICFGIILFYVIDKLLGLFTSGSSSKSGSHDHDHHHSQNIFICLLGDVLHNVADGLAIGAAFYKNMTLGIGLTVGIFFHEIPHEVGDFSYLLKQNLSLFKVFMSQVFSAGGAFLGVYLSTVFGETYSTHILCFSCGSFLYLSINTILGELKTSSEHDGVFEQFCTMILEGLAIASGIFFMTYFI